MIPFNDAFLGAAGHVGHVDADGLGLADAVEAADALFEEAGVEREVEEDEVVGELEVAALAADFGAEEELRAVGLGEPCGLTVALDERQALVEKADLHGDLLLQRGLEGGHLARGFADEQGFPGAVRLEKRNEPVETRVVAEGVTERGVVAGFLGAEFAGDAGESCNRGRGFKPQRVVAAVRSRGIKPLPQLLIRLSTQWGGAEFPLGETGHRGAGVAKHDPARAMLIEEGLEERLAGAGPGLGEGGEVLDEAGGVAVENSLQRRVVFRLQRLLLDDFHRDAGDGAEALGFFDELTEVVVTGGIEEAQACEVTGEAELRRGGGEEEQAGAAPGELLDERVFGADGIGRPREVVRLINDDDVPTGGEGLVAARLAGG